MNKLFNVNAGVKCDERAQLKVVKHFHVPSTFPLTDSWLCFFFAATWTVKIEMYYEWKNESGEIKEFSRMKRLSLEIPLSLLSRIKYRYSKYGWAKLIIILKSFSEGKIQSHLSSSFVTLNWSFLTKTKSKVDLVSNSQLLLRWFLL